MPWFSPPPPQTKACALVIGAGLAGCSISHALSMRGWQITLLDAQEGVAQAASANSRCVFRPHVTRTAGVLNQFNQQAFQHTLQTLQHLALNGHAVEHRLCGVLQLFEHTGTWPELSVGYAVSSSEASELAGITLSSPALHFPQAGWINAQDYCRSMIRASTSISLQLGHQVSHIERHNDLWRLHFVQGKQPPRKAHVVIVAAGSSTTELEQMQWLPLTVSAGQLTHCCFRADADRPVKVIAGKRFLIPYDNQCTIGSTHQRDHRGITPLDADAQDNLRAVAGINPHLSQQLLPVAHWRALRASTPDRLPVVGGVPNPDFCRSAYAPLRHGPGYRKWPAAQYSPGLYILGGLGSRGVVTASLTAKLLAEIICPTNADAKLDSAGALVPTAAYQALLHPARFLIKRLKRGLPTVSNPVQRK